MTYQEALKLKQKFGDTYVKDGMHFQVLVTPSNDDDFNKYLERYRAINFDDSSSQSFSRDNRYAVHGLHIEQGIHVIYLNMSNEISH